MITRDQIIAGDDLLTPEDLAKRWKVTTRTLVTYRNDGIGPQFTVLGKNTVRYRIQDVLAHEERRLTGGAVPARAEQAMRRAAAVLDTITKWKMRQETLSTVQGVRDDLIAQVSSPEKAAA